MLDVSRTKVMSSGHGALHLSGMLALSLHMIGFVLPLKAIASMVSLGAGFRGGLFFASLLMGALAGRLFALAVNALVPAWQVDPNAAAIVGMSALSASVIGGPLTMIFIARGRQRERDEPRRERPRTGIRSAGSAVGRRSSWPIQMGDQARDESLDRSIVRRKKESTPTDHRTCG